MAYYLLRTDGTISDIHSDGAIPIESRPEGQWVEGTPPEGAHPYQPTTLIEKLVSVFSSLADAEQAAFGAVAASVLMFVQFNNPAAAKLVIQSVPVTPDLQAKKDALLAVFNAI